MNLTIAMVALVPGAVVSPEAIQNQLAEDWQDLPAASDTQLNDISIAFQLGETSVIIGRMAMPIPWADLEDACATSWLWPEATEQLREHTEHLIVTVADDAPVLDRTSLLTKVTAAILATCPQAIGVYWGNAGIVVSPQLFRDFTKEVLPYGPPLHIWVDFRVGANPDGTSAGFTHGLKSLELMDLETVNASEPPGELRQRLIGIAGYLLENGPVIDDGDTVGEDERETIRVQYTDSAFGQPDQVMRLVYQPTLMH